MPLSLSSITGGRKRTMLISGKSGSETESTALKNESGLIDAEDRLHNVPDIGFVHLDAKDVVRHELVQKIIKAYEK